MTQSGNLLLNVRDLLALEVRNFSTAVQQLVQRERPQQMVPRNLLQLHLEQVVRDLVADVQHLFVVLVQVLKPHVQHHEPHRLELQNRVLADLLNGVKHVLGVLQRGTRHRAFAANAEPLRERYGAAEEDVLIQVRLRGLLVFRAVRARVCAALRTGGKLVRAALAEQVVHVRLVRAETLQLRNHLFDVEEAAHQMFLNGHEVRVRAVLVDVAELLGALLVLRQQVNYVVRRRRCGRLPVHDVRVRRVLHVQLIGQVHVLQKPVVILVVYALHVLRKNLVDDTCGEVVVSPQKVQCTNDDEVWWGSDHILKRALLRRVDALVFNSLSLLVALYHHLCVQNAVVHRRYALFELWQTKILECRRYVVLVVLVLEQALQDSLLCIVTVPVPLLQDEGVVQDKQRQVFVVVYQALHQELYIAVDDFLRAERQHK